MEKKSYNMNLTKRYTVTFVKNGVRYKKGDTAEVNMPTAHELFKSGKISVPAELLKDAREQGCEELFTKKK